MAKFQSNKKKPKSFPRVNLGFAFFNCVIFLIIQYVWNLNLSMPFSILLKSSAISIAGIVWYNGMRISFHSFNERERIQKILSAGEN